MLDIINNADFMNAVLGGAIPYQNAEITFANGSHLTLIADDFSINKNSLVDGAGASTLPIGYAVQKVVTLNILNHTNKFSAKDFKFAKFHLYTVYNEYSIDLGTFTVVDATTSNDNIVVVLGDAMYLADATFVTNFNGIQISDNCTLGELFEYCCTFIGKLPHSTVFYNSNYVVNKLPKDTTFRQVFGWIAQLACGNIRIGYDEYVYVHTYNFRELEMLDNHINGGIYDINDSSHYTSGNSVTGGTYAFNDGDTVSGGSFTETRNIHVLSNWITLDTAVDEIVITGVAATKNVIVTITEDEDSYEDIQTINILNGTDEYVISLVENMLILNNEDEAIRTVGDNLIGGRIRFFAGESHNYPIAEFMDYAYIVDKHGNVYTTIITDVTYTWFGKTVLSNSIENTIQNASKFGYTPAEIMMKTQQEIQHEATRREIMQQQLMSELARKSGLFLTIQTVAGGGKIYYMHNQDDEPDTNGVFPKSTIVWKMNAYAIGISNDGGQTYPYILDNSGSAILNRLNVNDLFAKTINATGKITASNLQITGDSQFGNLYIFNGGNNNYLRIYDSTTKSMLQLSGNGVELFSNMKKDDAIELDAAGVRFYGNNVVAGNGDTVIGSSINTAGNCHVDQFFSVGNKTGYTDGKAGFFVFPDGYMHIQRLSSSGYPYLGFLYNTSTTFAGIVRALSDSILNIRANRRIELDTDNVHSSSATGQGFIIYNGTRDYANNNYDSPTATNRVFCCGGADGTGVYFRAYPAYSRTYSSSANLVVTDSGIFGRHTSSSIRYKNRVNYLTNEENSVIDESNVVEETTTENLLAILDLPICTYHYQEGYVTGEAEFDYDKSILGFIAEDVESIMPECVVYKTKLTTDEDGTEHEEKTDLVENWSERAMIPRMLYVIQHQEKRINELESRLAELEAKLNKLL